MTLKLGNREVGGFEITRYDYQEDSGNIEIAMVKVLDKKGEYIKFAKLKEVMSFLPLFPVTFKKKEMT